MRSIICFIGLICLTAAPGAAVDFLGVELCTERIDTGVILPPDSPLSLESAEVGRHGNLVILLHSKEGQVLDQVDDLMAEITGIRGVGDERRLEWSSDEITGFAQVIKEGYVALAVAAADGCTPAPAQTPGTQPADPVPIAVPAAIGGAAVTSAPEPAGEPAEFELKGRLKHAAADGGWVDVMGVVVNNSGVSHNVASFDISLYDNEGELICVDTISVNQLRAGQERAFRASIRCADYDPAAVAGWKLQFAGSH